MDADTILNNLRLRGINVVAIGNAISLKPKRLINDRMVAFIRKHKQHFLTALYQQEDKRKALHRERKGTLHQGRLEVLKVLLRRFLNDPSCRAMVNYKGNTVINDKAVEDYLDSELVNFDYDLEAMIDMYRVYTPEPVLPICKCGYRAPFCTCIVIQPERMSCDIEFGEPIKEPAILARSILDSKMTLEKLFAEAKGMNIEFLKEDTEFLTRNYQRIVPDQRSRLIATYVYHWLMAMENEPLPHKKQNVGRFAANTFLQESLTTQHERN